MYFQLRIPFNKNLVVTTHTDPGIHFDRQFSDCRLQSMAGSVLLGYHKLSLSHKYGERHIPGLYLRNRSQTADKIHERRHNRVQSERRCGRPIHDCLHSHRTHT